MKVSQEARDHAADYLGFGKERETDYHRQIRSGEFDHPLAYAFAAFEQSIRDKVKEEAAAVAENWGYRQVDLGEPEYEGQPGIWGITTFDNRKGNEADIAAAIRQMKEAALE